MSGYEMLERQESFEAEVDLASRWLGGSVLAASDESFGEKEALLTPTPSAFVPGSYGPRGEIVDGWETRRRREPGHDWALIRLGAAGIITAIDVDTSCFTGNFPTTCRIEACGVEGYPSPTELNDPGTEWIEIVPREPLAGDTHNRFTVSDPRRFTHVRLSAYPDGGIARLRVHGHVVPDPRLFDGLTIDLASQDHGGQVITSSDGFYTSAAMLNRPDKARTMGEGWETRRRRDDGNDHAIIRLALSGRVRLVEIDTAHFKYNASAEVALSVASGSDAPASGNRCFRGSRCSRTRGTCFALVPWSNLARWFGSMLSPTAAYPASGSGVALMRRPEPKPACAGSTASQPPRRRLFCCIRGNRGTGDPNRKLSPAAWIITSCGDRCPHFKAAAEANVTAAASIEEILGGRESLRPQLPGAWRPCGWKDIIPLVFVSMAFRFGALRYGAPKRKHPASADRSRGSVEAVSIRAH